MCRLPWAQTDRQTHSSESKHSAVAALKRSRDERTTTKITKTAVRIFATVSKAHGPWCVPQYTRCPCRVPTTALWVTIPGLLILSIGARYIHGFGSRLVGTPESRQQKSLQSIQKVQKNDSHTGDTDRISQSRNDALHVQPRGDCAALQASVNQCPLCVVLPYSFRFTTPR